MKKTISFFWLCFLYPLFISPVLAEMSDQEKREFIESLAEPSKEKRVFYRWQTEARQKQLLEAGEMTPEIYERAMAIDDVFAGSGIYVAGDPISSSNYGNTIIQVELEPGYKYLNLLDGKVQKKLRSVGLTEEDVYRLNPRVAVSDIKERRRSWWVLKAQEGVKFKAFSPKRLSLFELSALHSLNKSSSLNASILREVLKRAKRDLSSVVGSPFIDILKKKYNTQSIVRRSGFFIDWEENGVEFLDMAKRYLKPEEIRTIVRKSISLMNSAGDGWVFLYYVRDYLEPADKKQVINRMLELNEELGLKYLKELLTGEEYQEARTEFENYKKAKIRCLRKWLAE